MVVFTILVGGHVDLTWCTPECRYQLVVKSVHVLKLMDQTWLGSVKAKITREHISQNLSSLATTTLQSLHHNVLLGMHQQGRIFAHKILFLA